MGVCCYAFDKHWILFAFMWHLSQGRTQERPKCVLGWLQKLTHVPLAIAILLVKFKFPSFRRTSTKYNMKQQSRGQLCVEQTSKIWCKNIHAFLRNCGFRVGAFYFDAPCTLCPEKSSPTTFLDNNLTYYRKIYTRNQQCITEIILHFCSNNFSFSPLPS